MVHAVGLPPVRLQVHHALQLLSVPAAPGLIVAVRAAFAEAIQGATDLTAGDIAQLLRADEHGYRTAADDQPYRLCPALTAEHLAPARDLLALSAWPLERRIVGPRSRRVDMLTAVVRLADQARRMPGASRMVTGLLRGFADHIPGAPEGFDPMRPWTVGEAARAELAESSSAEAAADAADRAAAADRARARLTEVELLYGVAAPASPS